MLAILGYFSMFSPNDHTDICLSEQQDCTESTLLLYILRDISILRLNILKTRENGHNMHQNGHIWYFLAILLLEPFGLYVSVLHVEGMRLFHPSEKMLKILLTKN